MAKNSVADWDETPINNSDVGGINTAEGMLPSAVNNALREIMAQVKAFFKSSVFRLRDGTDQTKQLAFGLSSISTATTRTLTVPNASGTIALTSDLEGRSGFRNQLINGNFDFWQRGTSQTSSGYGSDDRWTNDHNGSTKTASRQTFTLGQTDVPGNPAYFARTVVSSVTNAANYVLKRQAIEDVRKLAAKKVTVTFYAKADASRNMAVEVGQNFGTGGSPSAYSVADARLVALTTSWQKFTYTVDMPSISGKTLGSNNNDYTSFRFWFDAGSSFNANAASLGQQSGTFDIARVSIVEGDATSESDPFSPRHIQQELALCHRYFRASNGNVKFQASTSAGDTPRVMAYFNTPMRTAPTVVTADQGSSGFPAGAPSVELQAANSFAAYKTASSPGNVSFEFSYTADAEL